MFTELVWTCVGKFWTFSTLPFYLPPYISLFLIFAYRCIIPFCFYSDYISPFIRDVTYFSIIIEEWFIFYQINWKNWNFEFYDAKFWSKHSVWFNYQNYLILNCKKRYCVLNTEGKSDIFINVYETFFDYEADFWKTRLWKYCDVPIINGCRRFFWLTLYKGNETLYFWKVQI